MRTTILSLLTALILVGTEAMAAVQSPYAKSEIITTLTKLRDDTHNKIADIEQKIQKSVDQTMNTEDVVAPPSEKEVRQFRAEMKDLRFKQDFLDRLIFQVDTQWKEQVEFKRFFSHTVQELAKQDATNTDKDGNWTYISQLGLVLKETSADRGENPMTLLEDYLRDSTLQKTIKPKDFLSKRHYSNGKISTQSNTPSKETVGDLVDKKIKSL